MTRAALSDAFSNKTCRISESPRQPNACPIPENFLPDYAETLVFIHFPASSIFRELPSPSAEIRCRPAADSIPETV